MTTPPRPEPSAAEVLRLSKDWKLQRCCSEGWVFYDADGNPRDHLPNDVALELSQLLSDYHKEHFENKAEVARLKAELAGARAWGLERAAEIAGRCGQPVGAGDGDTYIPGTSSDAVRAIRAEAASLSAEAAEALGEPLVTDLDQARTQIAEAQARCAALTAERDAALRECSVHARQAGEAIGRLKTVEGLFKEVCDDLQAEIDARYPADMRATYPSQRRRYERDMDSVFRARAALAAGRSAEDDGGWHGG